MALSAGRRSRLVSLLGVAFGVVILVLVVRRARLPLVVEAARDVSTGWLLLAMGAKMSALFVKIGRWRVTWNASFAARPEKLASATLVGYVLNGTLPARIGDVVRVHVAARANGQTFTAALGSLALDRTLDALVLGAMVLLATTLLTVPAAGHFAALALLMLALPIGVVAVALAFGGGDRLPQRLRRLLAQFRGGLAAARSPRIAIIASSATVAAWALEVVGVLLVLRAFDVHATAELALFLTTATAVGLAVPSAPSGLGVHQVIYQIVLAQVGVSAAVAVAASVVSVGTMLLVLAASALCAVWVERVPLSLLSLHPDTGGENR